MHMTTFAPDESPRSLQLYTVDPATTYAAARMIADDGLADHVDMNFGCPVPKVTRRGGGAALPFKRRLFGQIVAAAVRATEGTDIPVTVKFRIGIDDEHHTHLDAGRIAESGGRRRGRPARPHRRAALFRNRRLGTDRPAQAACADHPGAGQRRHLRGQRCTGHDGHHRLRRRRHRPRLPGPAMAVRRTLGGLHRQPAPTPPTLGEVADIIRRHGALLAAHFGEDKGMRDIRKHIAWYLHGFPAGSDLRRALALVKTLDELDGCWTNSTDRAVPGAATGPRGRQGSPARVALPDGWLTTRDDCTVPVGADVMHLGWLNRNALEISPRDRVSEALSVRCGTCLYATAWRSLPHRVLHAT